MSKDDPMGDRMKRVAESLSEPTYTVRIYMAGDIATAKSILRQECYERGLCVTVEPVSFIYSGGEEEGFAIGFVNYPRFPDAPVAIFARATDVARKILVGCFQRSALVVGLDRSEYISIPVPGARK